MQEIRWIYSCDIVPAMKNLEIFVYHYCNAISEHNLLHISTMCKTLKYIDGTGGKTVSYSSALGVLSSLCKLEKIAVMPKEGESKFWSKLITQFHNVTFAYCIRATLPYEGHTRQMFSEICKLVEL